MGFLLPVAMTASVIVVSAAAPEGKVLNWTCAYESVANPNGVFKQDLTLSFTLDPATQRAVMVGNKGPTAVEFHASPTAVIFMRLEKSGSFQVTSIDAQGRSVHTQHNILGNLIPSQSYGRCTLK